MRRTLRGLGVFASWLVLMILFALVLLGAMTAYGIATFSSRSLVALGTVVAVAAAGVAFSRYRGKR